MVPGPWSLVPGTWSLVPGAVCPGHGDHAAGGRLWLVCDGSEWREGPFWNLHTQEPAVVQGVGKADVSHINCSHEGQEKAAGPS